MQCMKGGPFSRTPVQWCWEPVDGHHRLPLSLPFGSGADLD